MKNMNGIIDGVPCSNSSKLSGRFYSGIDNELIDSLSEDERKAVIDWIKENIIKRKTANYSHTSYGMKHLIEQEFGIYLTNNQFKHAMLICGFYPVNEHELNWVFRISEKSKAFRHKEKNEIFCGW